MHGISFPPLGQGTQDYNVDQYLGTKISDIKWTRWDQAVPSSDRAEAISIISHQTTRDMDMDMKETE